MKYIPSDKYDGASEIVNEMLFRCAKLSAFLRRAYPELNIEKPSTWAAGHAAAMPISMDGGAAEIRGTASGGGASRRNHHLPERWFDFPGH
jgi:hypothetical protein